MIPSTVDHVIIYCLNYVLDRETLLKSISSELISILIISFEKFGIDLFIFYVL